MENSVKIKLTVYFENPFWVGVFEKNSDCRLEACRVVFGSEPKDEEVYAFIKGEYMTLAYGQGVEDESCIKARINPKRLQRQIKKLVEGDGIGTKAQEALSRERELRKIVRKKLNKEEKEAEKKLVFERKQQKKREKKKGH